MSKAASSIIIEAVPNFSEGRDKKKIEAIKEAFLSTKEIQLLDIHSDQDHNRSVFTIIGPPQKITEACFKATQKAAQIINLNNHSGIHPFIGATDVIPLIPLKNITYKETIKLAVKLAQKISKNLAIPTYLYEKAARETKRKNLAYIRNKGFKKLKTLIKTNPNYFPDFGPQKLNKAGATMVSVRKALIAYNINISSKDKDTVKNAAQLLRGSSGGLAHVKALGVQLKSRNLDQITMNLTNYKKTSIKKVFEEVQKLSKKLNFQIVESELVGLLPPDALKGTSAKQLLIKNFHPQKSFLPYLPK